MHRCRNRENGFSPGFDDSAAAVGSNVVGSPSGTRLAEAAVPC